VEVLFSVACLDVVDIGVWDVFQQAYCWNSAHLYCMTEEQSCSFSFSAIFHYLCASLYFFEIYFCVGLSH
jgi:hypothetical protein